MTTFIIRWSLESSLLNVKTLLYSNTKKKWHTLYIFSLRMGFNPADSQTDILWYLFVHTRSKKLKGILFMNSIQKGHLLNSTEVWTVQEIIPIKTVDSNNYWGVVPAGGICGNLRHRYFKTWKNKIEMIVIVGYHQGENAVMWFWWTEALGSVQ